MIPIYKSLNKSLKSFKIEMQTESLIQNKSLIRKFLILLSKSITRKINYHKSFSIKNSKNNTSLKFLNKNKSK